MTLSVRALDQADVLTFLSSELRCRGALPALRTALIADHVRTLIWAPNLRANEDSVAQPVHTSRIFAALGRNTRFLFSPISESSSNAATQAAEFEFVRNRLALCGDIFHIGNGDWIPGPLRLVRPSESQAVVVVGGAPTSVLQRILNGQIRSIGPARFWMNPQGSLAAYPVESAEDWIGTVEPLATWTEKTLTWAASQLEKQADIEDDSLEIYAPDILRGRRRLGVWVEAKDFQEPSPTMRLFRPKMPPEMSYDRPDYLGVFSRRSGMTQLTRAVRISRDTAYRLRFGLDQKLGTPRTMNLRRVADSHSLDLKFALPNPEAKVLGLAWQEAERDLLFFDDFALPVLKDVVSLLGIRLLHT